MTEYEYMMRTKRMIIIFRFAILSAQKKIDETKDYVKNGQSKLDDVIAVFENEKLHYKANADGKSQDYSDYHR